ncbi:MAG: hypothetical protein UHO11_05160 [Treponema sp.]|nr:hypothetical protein [Treponema sp.]
MIFTSIYYIFFASSVILYGAGLNSSLILSDTVHGLFLPLTKIMFSILFSCVLTWLLITNLLVPLKLLEFYPLVALIIFLIISTLLETVVRITTSRTTAEFSFSYLIILLAINESLNMLEVIIISICSFFSFVVLIPVIYSLKKRIMLVGNMQPHGNRKSMLLISLAVIITLLAIGNVSWLGNR